MYLSTYIRAYLSMYLSVYLSIYLSFHQHTYTQCFLLHAFRTLRDTCKTQPSSQCFWVHGGLGMQDALT